MSIPLIIGLWLGASVLAGLWLGAAIRQAEHEARMADLYRRRMERENAMHRNGHRTSRERVRQTIERGDVKR